MITEGDFELQVPIDKAGTHLLEVKEVAPRMPGGELNGAGDDMTWKGNVTGRFAERLGPNVAAEKDLAPGVPAPQVMARPISGIRLAPTALGSAIPPFLGRLFRFG